MIILFPVLDEYTYYTIYYPTKNLNIFNVNIKLCGETPVTKAYCCTWLVDPDKIGWSRETDITHISRIQFRFIYLQVEDKTFQLLSFPILVGIEGQRRWEKYTTS